MSEPAARSTSFTAIRLFLNLRLAARVTICVTLWERLTPPVALACLIGSCLYDVLVFLGLRRWAVPVPARLVMDVADVAAWSAIAGDPIDAPSLLAAPLAYELALERGWRALVVPLTAGTAANLALTVAGWPYSLSPFLLPAGGVAGGLFIARYLDGRLRQRQRVAAAEREAARSQAELAGRHSVAVGADTVVDLLTRTWPLLAGPDRTAASPLSAWRQRLAEETADHAEYLAVALMRWEQRHNLASPDLARDVEFRPVRGASLLLSPAQVAALEAALERSPPAGVVAVAVDTPRPLGRRQELRIGGAKVVLPEDAGPRTPPFDGGPIAIGLGAIGSLSHSYRDMDGVPLPFSAALTVAGLLTALWCHRRIAVRGTSAHGRVMAAGLAFGAVDAVVSTSLMQTMAAGGLTRMPFLHAMMFVFPLTVMYWRDLPRHSRAWAVAGAASIVAGCAWLLPVPLHWADLAGLVWPLAFSIGASGVRDLLDLDTSGLDHDLAAEHAAAVREGYLSGRADVLRLVEEAAEEATRRLRADRASLDPAFLPEIERRLHQVRQRVSALRSP
ncbi:hypothetical protein [Nonomuraea rhizosphaerae]|uniref:hypothetical protein n=1 Tax=Nonomuraea rhizosphaerae TaxID=2665663 RepID=UPI001C5D58B4|nr:hypothetical protein [Nonomuraea rhizosphaerae]